MQIYIVVIAQLVLFLCLSFLNKRLEKPLFYFNIIVLILISTFRAASVGTDTVVYQDMFASLDEGNVRGNEYGWFLIYRISSLFNDFRVLLFIVSSMTMFFVSKTILDLSKNIHLSLLLFVLFYFYFASFNISRQILAVSICLFSVKYILTNDWKRFYLWTIIAMSIHTSAAIMLPMYFITRVKVSNIFIVLVVVSSYILPQYVLPFLSEYLRSVSLYSMYVSDLNFEGNVFSLNLLLHTIILLFVLFYSNHNRIYILIFTLGVFITNCFVSTEVIARLGLYFKIIIILLLPNLNWNIYTKQLRTIINVGIIIVLLIACLTMLNANDSGVCPYKSTILLNYI